MKKALFLTLVTGENCPACEKMKKILDDIKYELRLSYMVVDHSELPDIQRRAIRSIPVLIYNGGIIFTGCFGDAQQAKKFFINMNEK